MKNLGVRSAQSDLGAKRTRACDGGADKNLVLSAQYYLIPM